MGKGSIIGLVLGGVAAYGYYRYSKMSDQGKKELMNKGQKFFDDNLGSLKNMFGSNGTTHSEPGGSYEANPYSGQ
ncbi:MAG: hypothetical protein C4329_03320 [Chitinophagaceae bacterium]